jgi:ABC-type glycerol-3-phosphate transport system permease component
MRRRKLLTRWALFALLCVLVVAANLPILTMMLNSLRTTEDILSAKTIIPERP